MANKFCLVFVFLFILDAAIGPNPARGEDITHRFCIGMNWPGASVKYGLSSKFAVEGRYQTADNVNVIGPRLYYTFKGYDKLNIFTGLEADYVSFTGDVSKGKGMAGELFIGGEYFISRNLSFVLDIGPAFISLSDKDTSESVAGWDSVVNMGLNYYF